MKKGLIIPAVIIAMGMTSFTSNVEATNTQSATVVVAQGDVEYTVIKTDELPAAVSKSLQEGYADYSVDKAYKGTDGTYKVDLSKDTEKISVYFNADGKFLKIEQGSKEDSMK